MMDLAACAFVACIAGANPPPMVIPPNEWLRREQRRSAAFAESLKVRRPVGYPIGADSSTRTVAPSTSLDLRLHRVRGIDPFGRKVYRGTDANGNTMTVTVRPPLLGGDLPSTVTVESD